MSYCISFLSGLTQPVVIDKEVKSFIMSDNHKLMVRYEDGTDDMFLGVFSIQPFCYHDC